MLKERKDKTITNTASRSKESGLPLDLQSDVLYLLDLDQMYPKS